MKRRDAMEVEMPRLSSTALIIPALLGLSACIRVPADRETQVIVQPAPQQVQPMVAVAPGPPPAPHAELVPPPPPGAGPVVWQPGHWQYTGIAGHEWAWQPGQYVPPPPGQTTWIPGHWTQQPTGGWTWMEGHWA
jgi:hypothetical protein